MSLTKQTARYYTELVSQYNVSPYHLPFTSEAIATLISKYRKALADRDVLELACGTGFWTEAISATARSVTATDLDQGSISVVREKLAAVPNVRIQVADAYTLEGVEGPFTGAFAQLWWSHVPKADIRAFLSNLHSKLEPGSPVLFMDQLPYDWNRRLTDSGDFLEERVLTNGERFEIIKNFPSEAEIQSALEGMADEVLYEALPESGYWTVEYKTKI
jgi:SAM-dependent methyltransferase